jgi:DNA-binding beta-propeller fold protein YncE
MNLDSLSSQLPAIFPIAIAQENDASLTTAQGGEALYVGNANTSNVSVIDFATN